MRLFVLIIVALFNCVYSYYSLCEMKGLCSNQSDLSDDCKIKSTSVSVADCGQINPSKEDVQFSLGDINLEFHLVNSTLQLSISISFPSTKIKKAFLRISEYSNEQNRICKVLTAGNKVTEVDTLLDTCFWNYAKTLKAKDYLLQFKMQSNNFWVFKKVIFDVPNLNFFGNTVPVTYRLIFSYIDFTQNHKLVLKIQPMPHFYNVTQYKVEVFREREKQTLFVDVRFITANKPTLDFEFLTYSEEGYYYFGISAISSRCPEDACMKTFTSKVYISRKGTSLVIGIVGASFLIPFMLFIFYLWNCKVQNRSTLPNRVEKILILFNPSTEKHNDVVRTLAKTIKHLTGIEVMLDPVNLTKTKQKHIGKWCSDNLILATHIIYVMPSFTDNRDLDYMTYSFLKEEMKKPKPEKYIIVVNLPYSAGNVPPVLLSCLTFELMADFQKLLEVFQPVPADFNYENNMNCVELMKKIKLAQDETENFKNEMPTIVVTEQPDNDNEPKEVDVLL